MQELQIGQNNSCSLRQITCILFPLVSRIIKRVIFRLFNWDSLKNRGDILEIFRQFSIIMFNEPTFIFVTSIVENARTSWELSSIYKVFLDIQGLMSYRLVDKSFAITQPITRICYDMWQQVEDRRYNCTIHT